MTFSKSSSSDGAKLVAGRSRMSRGLVSVVSVGALVAVGVVAVPVVAQAAGAMCTLDTSGAFANCSEAFASTGAEQTFTVPASVSSVDIAAVGGAGAATSNTLGGRGGTAAIAGWPTTAGSTLYVEVGGDGADSSVTPAFNGGAANLYAGGGGGASDVRTSPQSQAGSLDSRIIVAGGGGGGGEHQAFTVDVGMSGNGGDAGMAGTDGTGGTSGDMGGGGGAGTLAAGGAGGTSALKPGAPGSLGSGGAGGLGVITGGNGGGGYYGGGGGGGGGLTATGHLYNPSGGGGGGSSFAPGGMTGIAASVDVPPSVTVSWREPVTLSVTASPSSVTAGGFTTVSASVSSADLAATDVTGQTVFTVSPNTAGTCTGNTCTLSSPGTATITGTWHGATGSIPVSVMGTAPTIAGTPPAATVGNAYSYAYTVQGTPTPTTSLTAGALPPGLTLTSNGQITGTPTTADAYTFTITATNGVAPDASITSTLTVTSVPALEELARTGGNVALPALLPVGSLLVVVGAAVMIPARPRPKTE